MTYEEFVERFKRQIKLQMGIPYEDIQIYHEGYVSESSEKTKWIQDTNISYTGVDSDILQTDIMTFAIPHDTTVQRLHQIAIRKMYAFSEEHGFDAAFNEVKVLQDKIDEAQVDNSRIDARATSEYETIRDQLILRPLNYDLHKQELRGCVYRKVNDFVLVLYQVLGDANESLVTSKIKRDELKRWGLDGQEDTVLQEALKNTARLYPPCVFDQRTQQAENFLEKDFSTKQDITFPTTRQIMLSTFRRTNGAVALFYPGVIEKMMKIMGGPFVAVFMNIHDVLIFDQSDGRAVGYAETAKRSRPMGEMLSGRTYLCDGKQIIPGIILKIYEEDNGLRAEAE